MNWEDFMNASRGQSGFNNMDFGGIDLGDIFGEIFGGRSSRRNRGQQRRGSDIQIDVQLTFREAVFGVEKEIKLTKNNPCPVCNGNGVEPGSKIKTCPDCGGQGQVRKVQQTILGSMQTVVDCSRCNGSGKIAEYKCKHCEGKGVKRSQSNYKVKIPAGIDNGQSIRLEGKGESAGVDSQVGDLYVLVHVKTEKGFERREQNIYTETVISYPQAVLGDKIKINTLDGDKKLVIPAGTQSNQEFRLKGFGVPYIHRSGRGDQYVKVIVDIPKKISRKGKKLLDELSEEL